MRPCALTENARPGNIEWMVDQELDALDELIRFEPLSMLVKRRFIDPVRMEPEQSRVSYRAIDFNVKAPRLGANADHGITQPRRHRFFFSGKRMKAR